MYTVEDIPFPLTGTQLQSAIHKAKDKRPAVAEGWLYEQTINMITADPGVGKSTISTQLAVELAAGLPVFGIFKPPKPKKVFYIQTERSIMELLERLETIGRVLPIVQENLFVTDEYQRFNLLNPSHADMFLTCVDRDCPKADVIIIDPIYATVAGGLKDDIPASTFAKVMSNLQKNTGAMLYYNHHNVKAQYSQDGVKIDKDDPFYGSQWLKAHVTGYMNMKNFGGGCKLFKKKDNYRLYPEHIVLEYDPETELCSVDFEELPAIDRLKNFLMAREIDQKEFYFKDIELATKIGTRRLRELVVHSHFKDRIFVVNSKKNKNLYTVTAKQK